MRCVPMLGPWQEPYDGLYVSGWEEKEGGERALWREVGELNLDGT